MAMAILVSLLVAFTLTPMMSSRLLKVSEQRKRRTCPRLSAPRGEFYLALLRWSLAHRRAILVICVVTFSSTFALYHLVGRDWIPADDQSELMSSFTLPEGTSLDKTTQMATDMAAQSRSHSRSRVRRSPHARPDQSRASLHRSRAPHASASALTQQMAPTSAECSAAIATSPITCACLRCSAAKSISPSPRSFAGRTSINSRKSARESPTACASIPELVDVNPSLNLNTPELQVKVDRQRAADIGVRMTDISDRGAPLLLGRRRDHSLQGRLRAVSRHHAAAARAARQSRCAHPHDGALDQTGTGAPGKRRHHRPRRRPGDPVALQPRVSGQRLCQRRFRLSARPRRRAHHSDPSRRSACRRLFLSVLRTGEGARGDHLESAAGDAAGFDLHVHGAGGAVRKLLVSLHHHAHAAAQHSLRAVSRSGSPAAP